MTGTRRLTPWLAGVGVVTFLAGFVPETKGRSLEEIQALWKREPIVREATA